MGILNNKKKFKPGYFLVTFFFISRLARHGCKESAKLKRIEAMDKKLLLESVKSTSEKLELEHKFTTKINEDTSTSKSKKKKKKKSKEIQESSKNTSEKLEHNITKINEDTTSKSKKKKKKKSKELQE